MVPNLKSARKAIEAELSHARQGIAYYSARVEALEIALHQLENVDHVEAAPAGGAKQQASAKTGSAGRARKAYRAKEGSSAKRNPAANGVGRHRRRKEARSANGEDALPQTGADFWFGLVSDQPQSAVDIANAAIAVLDIKPDQKTQIQKLKQRVSPALANLVSAQKIKDSGAGRERRFFRTA